MVAYRYTATVKILAIREHLWCPRCAVPSGTQLRMALVNGDAMLGHPMVRRQCRDCGAPLAPSAEDPLPRGDVVK